jgi:hypothetical protein
LQKKEINKKKEHKETTKLQKNFVHKEQAKNHHSQKVNQAQAFIQKEEKKKPQGKLALNHEHRLKNKRQFQTGL